LVTNEQGEVEMVGEDDKKSWGALWESASTAFDAHLESIPELAHLKELMFHVCDGNHRRLAWMNYITKLHSLEEDWHYSMDSIILETKGRMPLLL
jgi:hypothetical protein